MPRLPAQPRTTRRPGRHLRAAVGLLLVLAWAGCATLDRGQTLLPTTPQLRTGPFVVYAEGTMSEDALPVRCLRELERDVGHELGYHAPTGDEPVEIYILKDRHDFDHFLKFYYPELPSRRAFFIAKGSQRVVYTYISPRLEEDLRHEATHALLRGAFGDLPLWLDEGLAEYFETDLVRPTGERPRADLIAADLRKSWSPNLERLESMTEVGQMTQRDYREAWGWVHLLLNGPEPGKKLLMTYLARSDRAETKARLRPILADAHIDDAGLRAHLGALPHTPVVASKPSSASRPAGTLRFQDGPPVPTAPPPASSAPPQRERERERGLFRRLGSWLGL